MIVAMINIFMATIKVQVAGAPFDLGNIFTVSPVDAGPFISEFPDSIVSSVDGGTFSDKGPVIVEGGIIPLAGTATYNPNKVYGPTDIIELEFELEVF